MANAKKSVSLDLSALTTKVDQLKAIDEKLTAARGNMATQLKRGEEAADSLAFLGMGDTLRDVITQLELQLSIVKQVHTECRDAWIKANVSTAEIDALKAQRDTLVTEAESMKNVMIQLGLEGADKVELPTAPKATRSTGGSTPASKGVSYYYVKNGEKVFKSEGQNTLSSMAFYAPFKMPVAEFKELLKAAGWDGTLTTSAEFTVKVRGEDVTTGWIVAEPAATPEPDKSGNK